jgi:hypothetical protein
MYYGRMVTQYQLWALIAAPSVLALIGILLNQRGIDRLDSGLRDVNKRIDDLTKMVHSDVQGLLSMIADQGQRIVRLEERRG